MALGDDGPDMENRDPNSLNDHVKVAFDEVLGEPYSVHSIDCIWRNSYLCFECGKNCCYKFLTTLCGLCIALWWGCDFALQAFHHIWFLTPCMRDFSICVGFFQRAFGTLINCCCVPCCSAIGMVFSNIAIARK